MYIFADASFYMILNNKILGESRFIKLLQFTF